MLFQLQNSKSIVYQPLQCVQQESQAPYPDELATPRESKVDRIEKTGESLAALPTIIPSQAKGEAPLGVRSIRHQKY